MNAGRDQNSRPTIIAASENDGVTIVPIQANPTTHVLLVEDATTGSDNGNNLGNAIIDDNGVPVWTALSSDGSGQVIEVYGDPITNALLVNSGASQPNFNFFVDSVNGSDSNNGTSINTPYKTITKLLTNSFSSGMLIGLARGSHFREMLQVPANNISTLAYGRGARPILDCSDLILATSWSKTGGRTNVYQSDNLPTSAQSVKTVVNVWENGVNLVQASSIANCDATAGSFFASSNVSSPISIYVHSADNTNPGTNGKIYEYSNRLFAYTEGTNGQSGSPVTGCTVQGIQTMKNLHNDGSLIATNIVTDCYASYGTVHNCLVGAGAVLTNCVFNEAYSDGNNANLFVANANNPGGLNVTCTNCVFSMTTLDSFVSGPFAHKNVSGTFGTITFESCTFTNLASAGGTQDTNLTVWSNCTITGSSQGIAAAGVDVTVSNCNINVADRAITVNNTGTLTVNNGTVMSVPVNGGRSCLFVQDSNVINVDSTTFAQGNILIYTVSGTPTYSLTNNIYASPAAYYAIFPGYAGITSDFNTYHAPTGNFNVNSVDVNYATWKTNSGQDSHSVVV